MEDHKCSHRAGGALFPETPPKGGSGGNEQRFRYVVPELKMAVSITIPAETRTLTLTFAGRVKDTGLPVIGILRYKRNGLNGLSEHNFDFIYLPKVDASAGKAGMVLMGRFFKNFLRECNEQPTNQEAHLKALALDCATVVKNPAWMGSVEVKTVDDWKAIKKAERLTRKVDDLDYLLANRYMAEGWNKLRMAEVGKICGRILKRKPFPASTIKDRTTALDLQTTLKPGAQAKTSSLKAVEKYLSKHK